MTPNMETQEQMRARCQMKDSVCSTCDHVACEICGAVAHAGSVWWAFFGDRDRDERASGVVNVCKGKCYAQYKAKRASQAGGVAVTRSMDVRRILGRLYDLVASKRAPVYAESALSTHRELDDHEKTIHGLPEDKRLRHLAHLCNAGTTLAGGSDAERQKATRDLGFVQGALWWAGISSIQELETIDASATQDAAPVEAPAPAEAHTRPNVKRVGLTEMLPFYPHPSSRASLSLTNDTLEPGRSVDLVMQSKFALFGAERLCIPMEVAHQLRVESIAVDGYPQPLGQGAASFEPAPGYLYNENAVGAGCDYWIGASFGVRVTNISARPARIDKIFVLGREAREEDAPAPEVLPVTSVLTPRQRLGMSLLLLRIASWTNARFDQHLRDEIGDEDADAVLRALAALGVLPPECDPSGRIRASVPVVVKVENPSDKPAVFQGSAVGFMRVEPSKRPITTEGIEPEAVAAGRAAYAATSAAHDAARKGARRAVHTYDIDSKGEGPAASGFTRPFMVVDGEPGPKPKPSFDNSNPHAVLSETLRELHEFVELLDKEHQQRGSLSTHAVFAYVRALASTMSVYAAIVREISDFDRLAFEALTADVRRLEEYTGLRMARERHQREQDARRTTPADKESP